MISYTFYAVHLLIDNYNYSQITWVDEVYQICYFILLQEAAKLREQCMTQKRKIAKLDDTVRGLEGRKKFDPSKAFQHTKENIAPPASPKGIFLQPMS